jgi:hypothetical protein
MRRLIYRVIHKFLRNFELGCATTKTDTAEGHVEQLSGRTETCSVSPSVDMLPFGVTIPATVLQRSDIPEILMNYPL